VYKLTIIIMKIIKQHYLKNVILFLFQIYQNIKNRFDLIVPFISNIW